MIKILHNDEINTTTWNKLFDDSSSSSFFQSVECYDFYKKLEFLTPFVIAVEENETLSALVCGYIIADGNKLKRYMSRRAIIPGGILLSNNISVEALKILLLTLSEKLKSKAIYTEFRNYHNYSDKKEVFIQSGFKYRSHLNFQVPTVDVETASKQLSSTKRRDIKLSLREGAIIESNPSEIELKEFYEILSDLYKTKIKTPLFPFEFFQKIITINENHLFLVKHQGSVVGGSLCVSCNNNILYEWFVCGLDGKIKNVFPSTLATWAAIEYAASNKFRYFDMMGAGKPNEGYGVRDFKAKFGGSMVEHGRFIKINNKFLYKIGKIAVTYLKKKRLTIK